MIVRARAHSPGAIRWVADMHEYVTLDHYLSSGHHVGGQQVCAMGVGCLAAGLLSFTVYTDSNIKRASF